MNRSLLSFAPDRFQLHLTIEVAIWLLVCGIALASIVDCVAQKARRRRVSVVLAFAAMLFGALGYWRPQHWPSLGYSYESDFGWRLQLRSQTFFLIPMGLGALALVLILLAARRIESQLPPAPNSTDDHRH